MNHFRALATVSLVAAMVGTFACSKKSEPKPVIQSFESVCPTCGKSGAKIRPGNKARHFEVMREVGGVTYTHVRMDTVQCDHCPQAYTRKTYGIK